MPHANRRAIMASAVATFFHPMTVTGPNGRRLTADALVDTGSTFNSLPRTILEQLGVVPQRKVRMKLADGKVDLQDLGYALTELVDIAAVAPVIFGEPESPAIIGAVTLEIMLLGVDPVAQRLVPVEGWRA